MQPESFGSFDPNGKFPVKDNFYMTTEKIIIISN